MSRSTLRSPKGKLVEGEEVDGVWSPSSGMGLELKVDVLLANGWKRVEQGER